MTVCVRLHGVVVEERLLPLRDGMRLGDAPGAAVHFTGAELLLRVVDGKVWVRGRHLDVGEALTMELGAVTVRIEAHDRAFGLAWLARRLDHAFDQRPVLPDLRILLASMAIVLGAMTAETAVRFVQVDPVASAQLQAMRQALAPEVRRARIEAPEQLPVPEATAPEHPPSRELPPPVGFQP